MGEAHPNLALLQRLDLGRLDEADDLFAPDFVWHFVNSAMPNLQGDYVGVDGLRDFFRKLGEATGGSFKVRPVTAIPIGDEFVVAHAKDVLTFAGQGIELDAVVVWRIVDGLLAEAWDIPAIHTAKPLPG